MLSPIRRWSSTWTTSTTLLAVKNTLITLLSRGSYGSNGRKPYAVVNDETGKFWTDTWSLQGAIDCAGAKGISTKVISQEEYDGLFGTNGTLKY